MTRKNANRAGGSAIDELPEKHPVWLLMYVAPVIGALLAVGWFGSRLFAWLRAGGTGPGVLAPENAAVGAVFLFVPVLLAMVVIQVVASRRRRRDVERDRALSDEPDPRHS